MNTTPKFLRYLSNYLGWPIDEATFRRDCFKFNQLRKRDPALYTLRNLSLAMEYMRRKQIMMTELYELFRYVEPAVKLAAEPDGVTDVQRDKQAAIEWEYEHGFEDSTFWVGRLVRAQGPGILLALAAWRAHRGAENVGI